MDNITTRSTTFQIERVAAQMGVSRSALTLTERPDDLTDMVVYQLVRRVATLPATESLTVPDGWVQALLESEVKRSPIARWWVRRRPIRYRTYRAIAFFPDLQLPDRAEFQHRVYSLERSW